MSEKDEKHLSNLEVELLNAIVAGITFEFDGENWKAGDNSILSGFVHKAISPCVSRGLVAFENPKCATGKLKLTQIGKSLLNGVYKRNRDRNALSCLFQNASRLNISGKSGGSSSKEISAKE
jgi:hypothetical protein